MAFTDFSVHTLLVNSKALEIAGITKDTPDPPSGEMERDENGEPTGILKEPGAQALVAAQVPLLTRAEKKTALVTTLSHLNANGVTSFTDAAIGPGGETFLYGVMSDEFVGLYQELLAEGKLSARVAVLLLLGDYGALTYEDLENGLKTYKMPANVDKAWLQFPGIKIFADGIPLTYTSWMNEDYVSGDAGHGTSVIPGNTDSDQRENLIEMIKLVHRHGFQIGLHATGDRAIDAAVDGFVRAIDEVPGGDPRHYIIHGDFISPQKAQVLAKNNCGIAMQPFISVMISDFESTVVGEQRAAYEWPTRTVLDAGVNLTSNSDAPVTYPNWRLGVQAAVLREGLVTGKVSGPEECITLEEAIRTYTINGAYMGLKLGTIDASQWDVSAVTGLNWHEVAPYRILGGQNDVVVGQILFNMKSWNSLPDDLKKVMADAAEDYFHKLNKIYDAELKKVEALVKAGKVINSPIDDACDRMHEEAALQLWDKIGQRDPAAAKAIGIIKDWRKTLK